jgi:sarcosine oxidase subunit beta
MADTVVSATAGWSSNISAMAGLDLPIVTYPLQACVTEPMKPFMDTIVSSADIHVYVYQTDRGELVIGGAVDQYQTYSQRSTLTMLEELASDTLDLLPDLREVKIMRQWAGLCDMTPDYAPIIGKAPGLDGFILNCGWGTWGFKAAPASGQSTAELIATGKTPSLIKHFGPERFDNGTMVNERAAAIAAAIH